MIDTIAFDADDTLWHNETLYTQAKQQFGRFLSAYQDPETILHQLDLIESSNVQVYGYGIKSFTLSMVEAALELSEGKIIGRDLQQVLALGRQMLAAEVERLVGVEETLQALSIDYALMLITKGDTQEQSRKIERSGLAHYFKYIEVVADKTAAVYRQLLSRYALDPQQFLMVGNSLRSDILPVLEVGGQAVYIPYATTWSHENVAEALLEPLRYHEVEHLGQIPALIAHLNHTGNTSA